MSPKKVTPPAATGPGGMEALRRDYESLVRSIVEFGGRAGDEVRAHPGTATAFLRRCVEATAVLFQKWNLEILYLLACNAQLRFSEFAARLEGISSRTLSLKLGELERLGYVHRQVSSERPLRVDYSLTPEGRTLARLTVPLVMFLTERTPGVIETLYATPTARNRGG